MRENKKETGSYLGALGDWRLANAAWATAAEGVAFDRPRAMRQITVFNGKSADFNFQTPSAVALHLNTAWKAATRAHALRAGLVWSKRIQNPARMSWAMPEESTTRFFDYFEEMITAAFSSFAAMEAFCNMVIVERARGPLVIKEKGVRIVMSPEDVERRVSTTQKLKRVVPDLLCIPTPSGKYVWDIYVATKRLRDSVTHFKRRDQARLLQDAHEPTALHQLYERDPFSLPEGALAMICYFYPNKEMRPRWLANPSWMRSPNGV